MDQQLKLAEDEAQEYQAFLQKLEKLEELNFPNIENITKRINKKEYSKLDNQIFQMLNSVIN